MIPARPILSFHARKPFVEDFRAKEGIHFH